jgi:hypothetical protein
MNMADNCPFCRAKTSTSEEEVVKQLRPCVKKKKAWAQQHTVFGSGKRFSTSCQVGTCVKSIDERNMKFEKRNENEAVVEWNKM